MCGIFGLTAHRDVAALLVSGLERLEYRGYDSCGLVVLHEDGYLEMRKGAGEVAKVRREEKFEQLHGNSALGHTRWATHGRVSRSNAHPHFDSHNEIAIVHNGILENHDSLRRELQAQGHTFISETDSEVVAHLLEQEYRNLGNLEQAIFNASARLKGSYALGVISSYTPGVLYALRQESPLLLGIGDDFVCFASDLLAFSSLTQRVCYIENGEIAVIEPDNYRILSMSDGKSVARDEITLDLGTRRTDLGSHPDYMSKEISENSAVAQIALQVDAGLIDEFARTIRERSTTYLTGMGTAYYVAMMAQYSFARWGGVHLPAISSDELPYLVTPRPGDHYLAVSQSGETYDTLRALRPGIAAGATTSAILNVPTSSMAREVDRVIEQDAGAEICVLSTKSTISQLTLMLRIAVRLGELRGHLTGSELQECHEELNRLPGLLNEVWCGSHDHLRDIARRFSVIRNWFFLGRGIYHGLAMEAALKFKEVTYCHAEGMPAGFLKHGTISLIDEAMHTAIFLPPAVEKELRIQSLGAVAEINARGGAVLGFQPVGLGDPEGLFTDLVEYPEAGPLTSPLLALMKAQLFAYYTARALGRNVDKPRALAKSVTVG